MPPAHSPSALNHASSAWSEETGIKARSRAAPATAHQASSNGEMSDSSRASSVSRPAALRPLPASRRRRQKAEASRAAQLERAAAQTLQDAWKAHVARARVERRRALSRRRATKAAHGPGGAQAHPSRRAHGHEAGSRNDSRRYDSRSGASERASGRGRQQSGSAQMRLVSEDKARRAAALRLQRVMRGWQARRLVEETMGWSLARQAVRRGGDARCSKSSRARDAGQYRCSSHAALDDSELASRGVGRQTPLHSTGVGEESLEGLLQDLGL